MNAQHKAPPWGPNNPPPLRRDGESVEDYRVRCGWDAPKEVPRAQHTPGPWRYEVDGDYGNDMRHAVVGSNDLWVAACYRSGTTPRDERSPKADSEAQANARLIAAVPDLLAAAQMALDQLRVHLPELRRLQGLPSADIEERDDVVIALRTAIAKATGGAS